MIVMDVEHHDVKKAVIAAYSFFSGAVNFLVLGIPKDWNLLVNRVPPEVLRYRVVGNHAWVTSGYVTHAITFEDKAILGLEINVSPKKSNKNKYKLIKTIREGEVYIHGHKASYIVGEFEKGIISKTTFSAMRISYYCEFTRRWIEIYFIGKDIETYHDEILFSIPQTTCH